ncbi:MAG TPA: glycosyltransferase family 2 protein [Nitrospira sp.]|jgi:GT2 family glycosyltransferase|nr:glycosyltransferase family 2 protein [Nitrospira sp.]
MSLGAVVVHYHRESSLSRLLTNLVTVQDVRPENVVVVDNGSDEEAIRDVSLEHNGVRWIQLNNPGYGAAMNAGVAALPEEVDVVALLTHDVILEDECLRDLQYALLSSTSNGLVGPLLLDLSKPGTVWSVGGAVSPIRKIPYNLARGTTKRPSSSLRRVEWLDGSVGVLRRQDYVRVGGMAEYYFLYFEDVDFGWKLASRLGKQVLCDTGAVAGQSPGRSLDQYLATRNLLWLFREHRMNVAWLLFLLETILRLLVGPVARPRAALPRWRLRAMGLVAGLRQPLATATAKDTAPNIVSGVFRSRR